MADYNIGEGKIFEQLRRERERARERERERERESIGSADRVLDRSNGFTRYSYVPGTRV